MSSVDLSIVTTLYRSAPYLREFYARVRAAACPIASAYEIILVNDGSPDDGLRLALDLQREDPGIVVVDLSRNFGHHRAAMTGLEYAQGDRIFLIDCDLEEPPELLTEFDARFRLGDCDVVYGVQVARKGGWFERFSGNLFYRLFNWLSSIELPRNMIMARLMSRQYVRALLEHREREVFLAGLWQITGFRQVGLPVEKASKGETTYTLGRKLSMLTDSITAFSNRPLMLIFYVGCTISFLAGSYIAGLVVAKFMYGIAVDGWTSLIVSVWFLGGLTILFLGVIGIYLSKVFVETKRRPLSIVRHVHRSHE